ncbi:hypothetical protein GGS20DRAFT_556309 [Poronia punctata]|nr:hypothetical protein GGS20DRAFT_556309 [Poronia punctata]
MKAIPDRLRSLTLKKPTGYTFTDEMWRTKTLSNPRRSLQFGKPILLPVKQIKHVYHPGTYRTIAQRACLEDEELWESSSSLKEYEERKRALYTKRRVERQEWLESQPVLHRFPSLPPELRLRIWQLGLEEPAEVTLAITEYRGGQRSRGCVKRRPARPSGSRAISLFPPLMLVNHESHSMASAHYKRAFRDIYGGGGILAAYPTILCADRDSDSREPIDVLPPEDLELVQVFALTLGGMRMEPMESVIWKLSKAPNLKKIVVEMHDSHRPPLLNCVALRWLIEKVVDDISDPNLPEVEFTITGSKAKDDEDRLEEPYYFRGRVSDIPSLQEYESQLDNNA